MSTWPSDAILPFVTFAYNTVAQETMQMSPYMLVYGRNTATMLDAMLPNVADEENLGVTVYTQRANEAPQHALSVPRNNRAPTATVSIFDHTW